MATIDKLDLSVYNLYAIRTKMIEQIEEQIPIAKAGTIPPHTTIFGTFQQLTEIDILLGVVPLFTPWAYFYPPKNFRNQRRSSFAFYRVAPSLGSFKEQEEEEARLAAIPCANPQEEAQKASLTSCFKMISKLNGWLSFIVGRVGQFLQG